MELVGPLVTLSILLAVALVGGMIAHRLRQPIILGYLVIGVVAGPHALRWITDIGLIEAAASVGVALLMFTVGLEISLAQLRDVGRVGIWGGIVQVLVTLILGTTAGMAIFHWTFAQSTLFGLIISLSSTAICLKILTDTGQSSAVHSRIMIAFLILQDISVVVMMVLLPVMTDGSQNMWAELGMAAAKAILFIGAALVLGHWVLPWIFGDVGGIRSRELFLLTILVLCLGATIGTEFLGLSMVFGAFLIGVVLRSTRFVHQALAEITPLRDIFATLFFVSIGMLLDPVFVLNNWAAVLSVVLLIILIKVTAVFCIVRAFGYASRIALLTAAGLFQLGEFSFVLAQGGLNGGVLSEYLYLLILSSAVITMILTPFSIGLMSRLHPRVASILGHSKFASEYSCAVPAGDSDKPGTVIVAGYGRIGENLARGLDDAGIPYTIVDIDPGCIAAAGTCGRPRIYGDASNAHVLLQAGICDAKAMVIAFPDPMAVQATVKNALTLNPNLIILARYHHLREANALKALGVTELINPESEASFRFLKQLLKVSGVEKDGRKAIVDVIRGDRAA